MNTITDEFMLQMISKTKSYSVVILKATPRRRDPGADKIVWEHGRRNFVLRGEGLLPIVCPVTDDADIGGFGIFNADLQETRRIMDDDPAVKAGIFTYEVYTCRSFPGDALP